MLKNSTTTEKIVNKEKKPNIHEETPKDRRDSFRFHIQYVSAKSCNVAGRVSALAQLKYLNCQSDQEMLLFLPSEKKEPCICLVCFSKQTVAFSHRCVVDCAELPCGQMCKCSGVHLDNERTQIWQIKLKREKFKQNSAK